MHSRSMFAASAAGAALLLCTLGSSRAALNPTDTARRGAVAARIGATEITVGELEDRIAKIPRFQRATMGGTPAAVRRKFLLDVVIPEALIATGAEKEHLDIDPAVSPKVQRARANATVRVLRDQVGPAGAVSMDDIRKYYAENKSKFDSPSRYNLWRILCAKREEALAVLSAARATLTIDTFTKLAREHSIDKATNLRAGNLGFVDADGNSNEAGVKIAPELARAAAAVKDGELVSEPVPEGSGFAVIWRRGSVAASHRSAEDASGQIREALWRQRNDDAVQGLIAELREAHVTGLNEGVLNGVEVSTADGEVMPRRRPGQVPPLRPGKSAQKP